MNNNIFDWCFLSENDIMKELSKYETLIESSKCYFIPKAADYVEDILRRYKIYPGCKKDPNRILIIDVICDTGKTLHSFKEMIRIAYGNPEIITMSIIYKQGECDIRLFEIPQELHDKWFFGFGMDLICLNDKEYLREWPSIGWCSKTLHVDHPMKEFHPIYMILNAIGETQLLNQCIKEDYYDFSGLAVLTRNSSKR